MEPTQPNPLGPGTKHTVSGDEVPRVVLPVATAVHVQTTEELPVVRNIDEVRMNEHDKQKLYLMIIYINLIIILN